MAPPAPVAEEIPKLILKVMWSHHFAIMVLDNACLVKFICIGKEIT
jgi:hypothetical protein